MPIALWILGPPGSGKTIFYETTIKPLNQFITIDSNAIYTDLLKANNVPYDIPDKFTNDMLTETDETVASLVNYIFDSNLETKLSKSIIENELKRLPIKPEIREIMLDKISAYHSVFFERETLLLVMDAITIEEFPNALDFIKYKGPTLDNFYRVSTILSKQIFNEAKSLNANLCFIESRFNPQELYQVHLELTRKKHYQTYVICIKIDMESCRQHLLVRHKNINKDKFFHEYYGAINNMNYLKDIFPKGSICDHNSEVLATMITNLSTFSSEQM